MTFTYEALAVRVVFGAGSIGRLPEEAQRLGPRRLPVLGTPGRRLRRRVRRGAAACAGRSCLSR
ncbi:hypothetical protein J2X68_006421 [Streptomyces sp. 3330]|nr:hypothetical protein [Streptomyces sp. 3330]